MENTLNTPGSVRYLQAVIRLQSVEPCTTSLELRNALRGSRGVKYAVVESDQVTVCFDPQGITERAIESLLRQAGCEPDEVEVGPSIPFPFADRELANRSS